MVLDSMYNIVSDELLITFPAPKNGLLGIACDPHENDANFRLYVAHNKLDFSGNGGVPIDFFYAYGGEVRPT